MALEYGNLLADELFEKHIKTPVLFGGVLNQKVIDKDLPVDVSTELSKIGFHTDTRLGQRLGTLLEHQPPC